jgi:hypothetical protein
MSVRFLVRVVGGVAIGIEVARESNRDSPAGAWKAKVGPDAGSSLASGHFNAAGHATRGGKKEKGPKFRARAWSWPAFQTLVWHGVARDRPKKRRTLLPWVGKGGRLGIANFLALHTSVAPALVFAAE